MIYVGLETEVNWNIIWLGIRSWFLELRNIDNCCCYFRFFQGMHEVKVGLSNEYEVSS